MKTLRLISWQFSRRFGREIPIALQCMLISLLVCCCVTPFASLNQLERAAQNALPDNLCVISNYSFDTLPCDDIAAFTGDVPLMRVRGGTVRLPDDSLIAATVYSQTPGVTLRFSLAAGEGFTDAQGAQCIVGNELLALLPPGETRELQLRLFGGNMGEQQLYPALSCAFVGALAKGDLYLNLQAGDDAFTSNGLMTKYDDMDAGRPLMLLSLPAEYFTGDDMMLLAFPPQPEEFKRAFNEAFAGIAHCDTMADKLNACRKSTLRTNRFWLLCLGLCALLLVVNLMCYVILLAVRKQRAYGLYYRCGMRREKTLWLVLLPPVLACLPATLLGVLAARPVRAALFYYDAALTAGEMLLPLAACCLALFPAVLFTLLYLKRLSPGAILVKGE